MQQITRDRAKFLPWQQRGQASVATVDPNEKVVEHNGVLYRILRQETLDKLLKCRWGIVDVFCFSFGACLIAGLAGYTLATDKPPMVIEKPVMVEKPTIIEKPVPVNSGCLAFCNR
jgi:hypothetical protein